MFYYRFCHEAWNQSPVPDDSSKKFIFFISGYDIIIIWCWGQKVFWPLWYQWYRIAPHCVLPQFSKTFVIRTFFFEKWLLTHIFGGSQCQKSSRKQACIGLLTFWPWYHYMLSNNKIQAVGTWAGMCPSAPCHTRHSGYSSAVYLAPLCMSIISPKAPQSHMYASYYPYHPHCN